MVTWLYCYLVKYSFMDIYGYRLNWLCAYMVYMDIWLYSRGYMVIGFMFIWLYGYMVMWLYGYMVIRLYG